MKITESQLRAIIKKQLAEVLKGTFSPQQAFNTLLKEYASFVPLFKQQPNNIESLKNSLKDLLQKTPQSGIKEVIRVEAPTIKNGMNGENGMIYGSFVEFIAVDGKKYKFNYAPSVSTLVDVQTSQIIYRN